MIFYSDIFITHIPFKVFVRFKQFLTKLGIKVFHVTIHLSLKVIFTQFDQIFKIYKITKINLKYHKKYINAMQL